jgi:hypothetical protein
LDFLAVLLRLLPPVVVVVVSVVGNKFEIDIDVIDGIDGIDGIDDAVASLTGAGVAGAGVAGTVTPVFSLTGSPLPPHLIFFFDCFLQREAIIYIN